MMYGFPLFGPLHSVGFLLFTLGLLFLIIWAVRTFSAARLRTWGIGLLSVGFVLSILSLSGTYLHWGMGGAWGMRDKCGAGDEVCMIEKDLRMMERGEMRDGMMRKDDGAGGMMIQAGGMYDDMMDVSMDDMAAMLDGKTGDAFDKAFIEGMIPHHQGAIDMANVVLTNAKHEELKTLARAIIASQQAEIDQMKQWLQAWGYAGTGATR